MSDRKLSKFLNYEIIFSLVLIASQGYGQILSPTGLIDPIKAPATSEQYLNMSPSIGQTETSNDQRIFSGQVPCNPSTFWLVSTSSIFVQEFQLINSVITSTGVAYLATGLTCLAYANENTGVSPLSPTFFSTKTPGPTKLWVFKGSSWDTIPNYTAYNFINCSGFGNDVYIDGYSSSFVIMLYHYSNGNFDTVYTCPAGRAIMVADQAVDANGNVYFFVGQGTPPYYTDSLIVMSPSGNIIKSYPISFGCANAFGSFIMGDTLYVGLGANNQIYPNSILPIIINQNTASPGTPIPFIFASNNAADLESCNPGVPAGLATGIEISKDLNIYPNPAPDQLTIKIPAIPGSQITEVSMISILGKQIHPKYRHIDKNRIQLQLENISPGLYFVKIIDGNRSYYGKFEHINN